MLWFDGMWSRLWNRLPFTSLPVGEIMVTTSLRQRLYKPDFLCVHGSRLYGLATDESDYDYRGLVVCPHEYYMGVNRFDQKEMDANDIAELNKSVDLEHTIPLDSDIMIHDIRRFCYLALSGQTAFLELLFVPNELQIFTSPTFNMLHSKRNYFLSKAIYTRFGSYAHNELEVAFGRKKKGKLGNRRRKLIKKFGYSPPNAANALRLMVEATQLLAYGQIVFPISNDGFRKQIMRVKLGEASVKEVMVLQKDLKDSLYMAHCCSSLPATPNTDAVNKLLIFAILMRNRKGG